MNCLIWLTISCWLALSGCPSSFFRFSSVATLSCSAVKRSYEACAAFAPGVTWTAGSSDPPLRTTFLGGGQGCEAAEFTAEFGAGAVAEQFGVVVFLRWRGFGAGLGGFRLSCVGGVGVGE